MTNLMGSNPGHDWPEGSYFCKCHNCAEKYTGPKRSYFCYKCDTARRETPAPDYEAIRNSKIESMRLFKESYDKAVKEGTITYHKI